MAPVRIRQFLQPALDVVIRRVRGAQHELNRPDIGLLRLCPGPSAPVGDEGDLVKDQHLAVLNIDREQAASEIDGPAPPYQSGASLRDVDLTGATLLGASLRNADLMGANLDGVDLTGVDCTGANIRRNADQFPQTVQHRLEGHYAWVKSSGVKGERAELAGQDLSHIDLTRVN